MLDNNMPVLNGIDTAKKIYEMKNKGQLEPELKVIMISGDYVALD